MRVQLRAARKEGFERIAVICGAWHVPALCDLPPAREDNARLKGIAQRKLIATWVPWTHGRLTHASGYGAGVEAPGFYQHLWDSAGEPTSRWLARVAQLLRQHDLIASTASVIEAARLAEALAALRDRPRPTLEELNEAALAVLCHGEAAPLRLIEEQLSIGERLGEVPDRTPMLLLQQDVQRQQKRLRLPRRPGSACWNSICASRTIWSAASCCTGQPARCPLGPAGGASGKGTFKGALAAAMAAGTGGGGDRSQPGGNTVLDAATARARDQAQHGEQLSELTDLVEQTLLAELPDAIGEVMERLQNVAALTSDIPHLMDSLPALARVLRYGNVRQTDAGLVGHVVDGLITRVAIGLPSACGSLDDEAAEAMFDKVRVMNTAIGLLQTRNRPLSGGTRWPNWPIRWDCTGCWPVTPADCCSNRECYRHRKPLGAWAGAIPGRRTSPGGGLAGRFPAR